MTLTDILFDLVAAGLAASKLVPAAAPYWAKLPTWLQPTLPVIVLNSPFVLGLFGVSTDSNLVQSVVNSGLLFLPGLKHAVSVTVASVVADAKADVAKAETAVVGAVTGAVATVVADAKKL